MFIKTQCCHSVGAWLVASKYQCKCFMKMGFIACAEEALSTRVSSDLCIIHQINNVRWPPLCPLKWGSGWKKEWPKQNWISLASILYLIKKIFEWVCSEISGHTLFLFPWCRLFSAVFAGSMNPLCVLRLDDPPQRFNTSVLKNTTNPAWDQPFIL